MKGIPFCDYNYKCSNCGNNNILGYCRMLDINYNGNGPKFISLPSKKNISIFGIKSLSDYCGKALYLCNTSFENGSFDMLACGNCWLKYYNCKKKINTREENP